MIPYPLTISPMCRVTRKTSDSVSGRGFSLAPPRTLYYTARATEFLLRQGIGVIAQLGERLNGIQEVGGSIPPGSTKISLKTNENR